MKAICVIPARYQSTRFPGKPLAKKTGKYLIQHVYEQASRASAVDEVYVATDDKRIADAVAEFGGKAMMTAENHRSGTDRVAEVARQVPADVVINLQCDEPELDPHLLDLLVEAFEADADLQMATLAGNFADDSERNDPNAVKVVVDREGFALYFSRSLIPYVRDGKSHARCMKHIGVYAFSAGFLQHYAGLEQTPLEKTEKLEQLRALENGGRIKVIQTDHSPMGIDTPEAYEEFVKRCRE